MIIRRAKVGDAKEISKIISDTIKYVNSKDYNKKQIKEWLTKNTVEKIKEKIQKRIYFVAVENKKIVGIITLNKKDNQITGLYIKHNILGNGIGTKLLNHLEKYAKRQKIKKLKLWATLTAYEFYKSKDYKKIRKINVLINKIKMPCVLMTKEI